tara:strand:- start:2519 stop:2734 length:216 start_codon:yes stop_codon:yes gene_type:complete
MMRKKVNKVMIELVRSGFRLTMDEVIQVTANHILEKYNIQETLNDEEKDEFIRELINLCWDNQLRKDGFKK